MATSDSLEVTVAAMEQTVDHFERFQIEAERILTPASAA